MKDDNSLFLGASTRCTTGMTTLESAKLLSEGGFGCTELCFVQSDLCGFEYNKRGNLNGISPLKVKSAADIYRDYGIGVTAIGVFTKVFEKEDAERKLMFDYFKRHMELAAYSGVSILATECGFTPGSRGINADTYESDYSLFKDTLAQIALEANNYGIKIALEGCQLDIIQSPRRLKTLFIQLKNEYQVTNVGSLTDSANYIALADEDDVFKYLHNCMLYMHGKDRLINATYGNNLGDGDINWDKFFRNYRKFTPDCPFILEYSNKDNLIQTGILARELYSLSAQ